MIDVTEVPIRSDSVTDHPLDLLGFGKSTFLLSRKDQLIFE